MKKGLIVTDLDDVIIELLPEWIHRLNMKYHTNVSVEDVKDWDMQKAFPNVPKDKIYEPLFSPEIYKYMKPVKDVVKYLNILHDEGFAIKIATASHYNCLPFKLEEALFPLFDWLTYKDIMIVYDKGLIKCDYLIDDYHKNFEGSDACKILLDKPYNKESTLHNHRCYSWKDIYEVIRKEENAKFLYKETLN